MMSTVVSVIESMLFTAILTLLVLCWLCEKNTNIAVGVWNTIVLIRDAWQVIEKDIYTTFKDEDPFDNEPHLAVSSSNQFGDQTSCSMTVDLVSQSFPICRFPFSQGGENTAQELEVVRNMQVVDLTIKRVKPVENSTNYLQFIYFDLNLEKGILSIFLEMFEYDDFHILDQLDCGYYRIDDSKLEIFGIFNEELIVLEMRLNVCEVIIKDEYTTGKITQDIMPPKFSLFDFPAHSRESSSSYIFQLYDQHDVHRGFASREHAFHGDFDVTGTVLAMRKKYEHCRRSMEHNRSNKVRADAWHLIVKDVYTTFKDEDPVDEEPELVVSSSDQSGDQISCSITADLVSRSFPLCHFPFPQGGENTAQELEEVMRNMQVVDLTIKRVQPIENSINYLQFVFFDLNLEKGILSIFLEMFEYVDFNIIDQLDCGYYRIDDSELEIVGIFNEELIVLEMRLNVCEVIIKNECTTGKNEEPDIEEPVSVDCSGNQACHQTSSSLTADLISPSFPLNVWPTETVDNAAQIIDPDGEEPDSTAFSGYLGCDQASSSSTADLDSPSFPLYVWPSETGDNAAQIIDESCMETIIQVVNLTIKQVQPVEKALKYFQFILFDLNMGEQMYRRIYCHLHDQLVWWYNRKGDSELEIVGKLYGGFIVQGMRLNLPDDWKPSARMVLNHLENYDLQYLNFARSAFAQLNQDIPKECLHLIKEMMDKPRINNIRKKKSIVLPSYAYSCEYL
ncbi:Hypothetical protein CINCED_3A006047 [Cinara cedri]|uniref:Uncharacterized protein n=1 Tax=Cinara cedri TaxID=506608 RepID=A0A5E4MLL1_9HEMI|nr:Hypothetical protein CINCED_3A006047 [Cinara cedri]